jgi:hypothetical protein
MFGCIHKPTLPLRVTCRLDGRVKPGHGEGSDGLTERLLWSGFGLK